MLAGQMARHIAGWYSYLIKGKQKCFAVLCTAPIILGTFLKYKRINLVRIGFEYGMLLYSLCLVAVVLFPLPTLEQAAKLSTHDIQMIPFHFVVDIINESPFQLTNPISWIKTLYSDVVLQVVFNVVLTIPLGVFLRYYCHLSVKKIVVISFFVSLVIEVTQLTGIYGTYRGSYRLCDMDDLITNTLGGYVGYRMVAAVAGILPEITAFDIKLGKRQKNVA